MWGVEGGGALVVCGCVEGNEGGVGVWMEKRGVWVWGGKWVGCG